MPGPLALLVLAAVPSLGVPGLTPVDVPPARVAFFEDHLIEQLSTQLNDANCALSLARLSSWQNTPVVSFGQRCTMSGRTELLVMQLQ